MTTKRKKPAKKAATKKTVREVKDYFPIEKGIPRRSGKHNDLVVKVLRSMTRIKESGSSFFVPTEDKGIAKSIQASVNYLKHQYKKQLAKGEWTTMTTFDKGKQTGVRIFFD